MADYRAMYAVLFRKITAVIEELQDVQRQTEELYISDEPPEIRLVGAAPMVDQKPEPE